MPAFAEQRPVPLRALEARGVTIVGTLPGQGGLTAYAGYTGQHPVALYVTPDGKHVVAGTRFDAAGNDLTGAANDHLMASLGLEATPGIVWRDAAGKVQMREGEPGGSLDAILGPR